MSNQNNNKRIARNTFFLYIRMAFVLIVALYTTRVILRVLGAEDYGIYNVVCGFVSMFGILNTSLTTGTNRFYNFALGKGDKNEVTDVYNASIRIQLIVVTILLLLIETVGLWYLNNKMVIPPERLSVANVIFQFAVFSLILLVLQIPYSAAVMSHERMDYYALVSITDVLLKLAFVFSLQYVSYDKLLIYGILMTITSVVNFLMYFIYCRKRFDEIRIKKETNKELFKSIFHFSAWSLLDPLTKMTQNQGSNLVLNYFFGPIVNAAQGIANQISHAIDGFTQNIAIAFRPQIIQSYSSKDYKRTKNLMFSMSRINFILHAILVIPVVFELHFLLDLWLGDTYPDYTIPFACFILFIRTFDCLHAPISLVMVSTGRIKKVKTVSLCIISSVIPLSILCFKLGMSPIVLYAIMSGLTLLNIVASALIMCEVFPIITFKEYTSRILMPCIVFLLLSLLPSFIITYFCAASLVRLVVDVIIAVSFSIIIAYRMILNEKERAMAIDAITKIKNKVLLRKK